MRKRRFLGAAVAGAVAGTGSAAALAAAPKGSRQVAGPTLLTVSGRIGAGNRGAFDPALDQLMAKQKLRFDKAHAFDFASLAAMPVVTIRPTLEYDAKAHELSGPLLSDVMRACGVQPTERTALFVRAIDGFAANLPAAEAARRRYIVATHLDGRPMALGGLGPLWTIYDADRFPDMAARPLPDRFGSCPWATYHVEVRES